ncbi:MAG: PAS domain-containing protein [Candidatus Rokubacteria bacterium]|nr:PAS domain-containing protein [Candidatus Rokubacteria bacterium]
MSQTRAKRRPDPLELLQRTADGVLAVDPEGRIVLWNAGAERLLGYPAREVLGRRCCEVLEGCDPAGNRVCHEGCHVLVMVRRGELVQNYDLLTRTKDGRPIWLNMSTLVIPGSRQGLETTVHVFRDVTYFYRLQELVRNGHGQVPEQEAPAEGVVEELTRRELQILRLIAEGLNTKGMADRLCVSPATVRNHVQNILGKLEVHSRLEAVALAMRRRLLGRGTESTAAREGRPWDGRR